MRTIYKGWKGMVKYWRQLKTWTMAGYKKVSTNKYLRPLLLAADLGYIAWDVWGSDTDAASNELIYNLILDKAVILAINTDLNDEAIVADALIQAAMTLSESDGDENQIRATSYLVCADYVRSSKSITEWIYSKDQVIELISEGVANFSLSGKPVADVTAAIDTIKNDMTAIDWNEIPDHQRRAWDYLAHYFEAVKTETN